MIHFFYFFIAITLLRCDFNDSKINTISNPSSNEVYEILKVNAEKYIDDMRLSFNKPIYITVKERENKTGVYEFSINVFDILLLSDKMPCGFSTYENKGENIIYYYTSCDELQKKYIKKRLIEKGLISLDASKEQWGNRLNDFLSWNLFFCKKNHSKIKIIKSPYLLLDENKPMDVCK